MAIGDYFTGYTETIKGEIYVLPCRTFVCDTIHRKVNCGWLKAPAWWWVDLQYVVTLLI